QTLDMAYEGGSSHNDKAESFSYSTSTGDVTQKIQYGQVTGSTDGSFSDTGTDKFATSYSYATSSTSTAMSLLSDESTVDQSSAKVRETRNYYDNLALGNVNLGNLTKRENWKSGSAYINSQKTYNGYGLVTQNTDPRGKNTGYTYESHT